MEFQDFRELLNKLKPLQCEPLELIKNDLSNDQKTRKKTLFDENDIYINHKDETLLKKQIIAPKYHDLRMLPLNRGSKMMVPKLINHGFGIYTVEVECSVQFPNPRDRRYPKPEGKSVKKQAWIYYDREVQRYMFCNQKQIWKEKINAVEEVKNAEWIMDLTWYFYDFYAEFYLSQQFNLINAETYHQISLILTGIQTKLPISKLYFEMLYLFGDVKETELVRAHKKIDELEEIIEQFLAFIHSTARDHTDQYNSHEDSHYAKEHFRYGNSSTIHAEFTLKFKEVFKPNTINKIANAGQIYQRIQLQDQP